MRPRVGNVKRNQKMTRPISAAFACIKGPQLSPTESDMLNKYNPVGITIFKRNIINPQQLRKLTDDIRNAIGRDDVLIAIDQEGGTVRRMRPPYWNDYISQQQIGTLDLSKSCELAFVQTNLIAYDLHNAGINMNFAPVTDTHHTNTTPILAPRCFSDDPNTVAEISSVVAKTYMDNGICPCIKHFPGHGLAENDPHLGLAKISHSFDEIKRDWFPFQKLSEFVPCGMTAHIIIPDIDSLPITMSKHGIDIIRNEIGFDGMLISDAVEMQSLTGTLEQRVKKILSAGCDTVCYCSGHDQNNPFMIDENKIVLSSAGYLSDKSLDKLEKIIKIISTPYQAPNTNTLKSQFQELVNQTTPIQTPNFDGTENWSDK